MAVWQIWIIVGIGLFIVEIITPGFVLASVGIGALLAAIPAALHWPVALQVLALAVGMVISMVFVRPLLYRRSGKAKPGTASGTAALVGKTGVVSIDIPASTGSGRVKLGGEDWKASSSAGESIASGQTVVVDKIEGATVFVTRTRD